MEILSIYSPIFHKYGKIIDGDYKELLEALKTTKVPDSGVLYEPSIKELEETPSLSYFKNHVYGYMDVQIGHCSGHNNKLNCLEYHKGNEINLANEDFILLLARYEDIVDGKLDTSKVVAFKVPAGVAVEVYAETLHYAPCSINGNEFNVVIVLPKGTNVNSVRDPKDPTLWATNKWLLAHKDTNEASSGAYIGLEGENITL